MDVNILNLQTLFGKSVRYEIPPFQRPYIWDQERQWEPLWDDVRNASEQFLEAADPRSAQNSPSTHFLGAVVLQQQPNPSARLETRLVVDGQQRLTTLQLLLDAAQEIFEKCGNEYEAMLLSELVLNSSVYRRRDPDHAFKVWPTLGDQEAFRHAMHNHLPSAEHQESLIVRAHEFFKEQIDHWLKELPEKTEARAEALERTITNLLEMVVIDLKTEDDPHVIFETLNARGTPLLQSDLIKNMVMFEAGKADDIINSQEASRIWGFDGGWWRHEIRQGRIYRPRIDAFLNYWLVMRTHREVTADNVFSEFRRYANKGTNTIESLTEDIRRVGEAYRKLEDASIANLEIFLYRWGVMQAGVLTPVLLWLLSSEVPGPQMKKSLRALESFLVRRMVCRMTTRGYNLLFISLVGALETAGATQAGDATVEYLRNQEAYSRLWPDNQQLEDTFLRKPLYRLLTRARLRLVLEGIEDELRTAKAESQAAPRDMTIEHILPQQWRRHWALPAGLENEIDTAGNRDRILHSIGNLTLVNDHLNPSLSNAAWEHKRPEFAKHSVLFLNKTLLDEAPNEWDESTIAERAELLFKVAVRVWPHADEIQPHAR